ncbi:putative nucleobase-ascorbate transporter [Trifolium repens]|nr:putative nucleobase-ascorbate transporter [Trifolium repens]
MIRAVLVMNTQGKPRLAKFYEFWPVEKQQEIIRNVFAALCSRPEHVSNFVDAESFFGPDTKKLNLFTICFLLYWINACLMIYVSFCSIFIEKLSHAPVVLDSLVPLNGKHGFLNVVEAFAMMAASLVSLFEFTGTSYAAARYGSATPVSPYIISHGASWVVRFNISI